MDHGGAAAGHEFDAYYDVQRRAAEAAAEPILADLQAAGLRLESISELLNREIDYNAQIPILVEWIPRCGNLRVREVLVRALAVPAARKTAASATLLREFESASSSSYRWAVALALTGAARPEDADAVVSFFQDRRYGAGRQELARVIARLRPENALEVLLSALVDDDVAGHAVEALGYLGDPRARPHLVRMKAHATPWIRKEAAKAIRKLDKPSGAPR